MTQNTQEKTITNELALLGIKDLKHIFHNLSIAELYEQSLKRNESLLSSEGSLVTITKPHTGRLPYDKFIVKESTSEDKIWWGEINRPIEEQVFTNLKNKILAYLKNKDVFVEDCYVGTDKNNRLAVRIISERAIGALFSKTMLLPNKEKSYNPEFSTIHVPYFHADPKIDGTHSEAFVLVNIKEKLILIGGTLYAGEIKKSAFSLMNYFLPQKGIMAMHASANYGKSENDAAIFFGLSGTGKTTLSADPKRTLIGDDEHGWGDDGIFNFEGGCYAKAIKLNPNDEPDIYYASNQFGAILENVVMDPKTREIDFYDSSFTENTRSSYPISHIKNMTLTGASGHPKNIIMLTCDAFGVLPPVAKLSEEQAMFYFIAGYTAKVAGTEAGIKEPQVTFSPCFGAPFMPLPPKVYAKLLGEKIKKHKVNTWLVNTGWSGGPYGVGERIKLQVTRSIIDAILDGSLKDAKTYMDPIFKFEIPESCPGVESSILNPKNTWKNKEDYDQKASDLQKRFVENYNRYSA